MWWCAEPVDEGWKRPAHAPGRSGPTPARSWAISASAHEYGALRMPGAQVSACTSRDNSDYGQPSSL
ncbi:hypothetical protein PV779_58755 [Streptomyces sp. ID01-9D]|nr:hypothetical protein [Streptomyces sp. ID01-9D]